MMTSGRPLLALAVAFLTVLAWCLGDSGRPATAAEEKHDLTKAKFYGVGACMKCHAKPGEFEPAFVKLTEYTTWRHQDKHALAYAALEGPRGQRMGQLLGGPDRPFLVTKEAGCLNCHSTHFPGREGEAFSFQDGVSCDGCHGPAEHWLQRHAFDTKMWRALSPEDKQREYGMFNVRDPIRRGDVPVLSHR